MTALAAPATLRICLLGPVTGESGDPARPGQIALGSAQRRGLLAYLALHPEQPVSRDQLVRALWGDEPPASAVEVIHNHVAGLRRALEPERASRGPARLLVSGATGYRLHVGRHQVDAWQFADGVALGQHLIGEGDLGGGALALRTALRLWTGRPLDGIRAAYAEREAARLVDMRLTAVEAAAAAELELGRHRPLLTELAQLTAEYPVRERLHGLLMLALCADGRQPEAVVAYHSARRQLREHLGVEPGEALQDSFRRVLRRADPAATTGRPRGSGGATPAAGTPAPARVVAAGAGPARDHLVPAQLPADLHDFTGRADQVRLLRDWCAARRLVVVSTVVGAGGIGKTSLAIHVGHRLRGDFPDGQLYANLRGLAPQPARPADVLRRFLQALGADPAAAGDDEEAASARFRTAVADRRMLIVLDDAADAAQVRPLLPGTASCAVIVTSRHRLAGLDGAARVDLDVMTSADGLTLFERIVGAPAVAAEPDAAWRVLRCCGGLPLAIRMAAARLVAEPGWSIRTLADRLSDRARVLDELGVEDRAVRATLAVAVQRLTDEQARAFGLLGRWTGVDIGRDAAAALLDRPAADTAARLDDLAEVHLMHHSAPGRYAFHDLIRAYATERPVDGEPAALRRLTGWYLHHAAAATGHLRSTPLRLDLPPAPPGRPEPAFADRTAAVAWLDTEHANLVAATGCAPADVAWRLPVVLGNYFVLRASWADWDHTCATGLDAARALGDRTGESRVLNGLGGVRLRQGRLAESAACLRDAVEIARAAGDTHTTMAALSNLAYTCGELGELDRAEEALLEARELNRQVGDRYSDGNLLATLARIALLRADHATAADRCAQAASVFQEVGNQHAYAMALNNLGEIHRLAGDQPAAVDALTRALAGHRALNNRHTEAGTLVNLGNAICMNGQSASGRDHWRQALDVMEATGDPRTAALRSALLDLTPQTRLITI